MIDFLHQIFSSVLIIIACICFYYLSNENKKNRKQLIWILYSLIFVFAFALFANNVIRRLSHSEVWDFTAFYLYGKVAAAGHNYYDPQYFHSVFSTLILPPQDYSVFQVEAVNVGFLYPPPTILLFTPLGFLSYNTALISWTIFNLLFAAGCIYLIFDIFLRKYKLNGLLLVSIMFFLLLAVRETVTFSQTNFILLFLLLLMRKHVDKKYSGILLALAFFTKPYMVIFIFIFIFLKKWKTVGYFIGTSLLLTALTFIIFSKAPFLSYIFDNPSKRLPDWVFSEPINQSLNAILIRWNLINVDHPVEYTYVSLGIILPGAIYLFYLAKNKLYDFAWAFLLLLALLIYPGTLSYYGVLLLFIVSQFFDETKQLGFKNIYLNILIMGVFYLLSSVSVFSAICFLLVVVVLKSGFIKKTNEYAGSLNMPTV